MKPTLLMAGLFAAIVLGAPDAVGAQGPRASPSAVVPLARSRAAASDLRVPALDLYELSRYAGWGGTIGAAAGAAYALGFEHGRSRSIMILWDGLVGFTGGLAAGTAVYVVKTIRESR